MTPIPNGYENFWWLMEVVVAPGLCALTVGVFFRRVVRRVLAGGVVVVGGVAILSILGVASISAASLTTLCGWLPSFSGVTDTASKAAQASPVVVAGLATGILIDYLRRRKHAPR